MPNKTTSECATGAKRCPRFSRCRANICPLDPDHLRKPHIHGEAICAFLREAAKNGGRLPDCMNVPGEVVEAIDGAYDAIKETFSSIRLGLNRAAKLPSKLGRLPPRTSTHAAARSYDRPIYPIGKTKIPYRRRIDRYTYTSGLTDQYCSAISSHRDDNAYSVESSDE